MEEILQPILARMSNKPQQKFMFALLMTLMSLVGKANFRNMSRFSSYHEKSFSRWYRKRFDFRSLNTALIADHCMQAEDEIIGVHDASFLRKSGKFTEGLGRFYSGCLGKAAKGLEASGLGVVNISHNTCYMLDIKQTKDSDHQARTLFYSSHVTGSKEQLQELGVSTIVADGYYAKFKFLDAVESEGLTVVSKLRKDCDLRYVYKGMHGKRGRPKKYDGKVDLSDLSRFDRVTDHDLENTYVFTQEVFSMITKKKIRVVVLKFDRGHRKALAVLFSTDPNMQAVDIIRYYKARFQIEFCFRDAKQHTGFEDCQSLKSEAIEFQLNASMTALNLIKCEDRLSCEHNEEKVISIASYKRFKYNQNFLCSITDALGINQSCEKIRDTLKTLCRFRCIAA